MLAYPVEEITIAGNLKDMFRDIIAIGSDQLVRGATRCGSILLYAHDGGRRMIPADAPGRPTYWRDACTALAAEPGDGATDRPLSRGAAELARRAICRLVRAIVGRVEPPPMRCGRELAAVPQLSPKRCWPGAPDTPLRAVGLSARKVDAPAT